MPNALRRSTDASQVYVANGAVRWACERAFWPLFMTRLVTDVGLSPLQLVLLGTVYEAAIFVSEIPTGVVADVYSRRLSVIISYILGGTAFVLSALASEYWLLVLTQILVGVGFTFYSGAETAWITDELGSAERAEPVILRRSQIVFVAAVVGILGFAGLAVITSLQFAIAATGFVLIAYGVAMISCMPEEGFNRTEGEGWAEFMATLGEGWGHVRGIGALRILALVVVLGGIAKEAIDRLDIQRLVDVGFPDDLDEAAIVGAVVAVRLLFAAGLLVVARRRVAGASVVPVMAGLLVMTAVGIGMLAHVELLAVAAVGLILQGGAHSATQPLVELWANNFASSSARATIHSFMGQGESIGEVMGGIALGTVAEVFTVPTAMTISAVLFLLAALISMRARALWQGPTG